MNRRRLPAWLASLALLIHLLSMPLSGLLPAETKRLLGWSGHCPLMQAQVQQSHALHEAAGHGEHEPGTHGGMPPCCCCAGSIGLAALPGASPLLPLQPVGREVRAAESRDHWSSPREQWPALNPRASPLA
ncbi:DUF2946 domain-containing protein [Pseudomonas stutzeri]|uniref:DUF2946 domain-containing protein n=1 Tax=Stutzerimonas stutzeri TaxID=316 RepID=A0A2N8RWP2_STUST|nr:DUF2946 family protein [Stutzerimonas stutzeri]MCQ4297747.1 DUF2946 domain-containing protein [Stutzerimonas stutzeri]PNF78762.1 hypothetical protein CXK92_20860 [Stutzerimonas stutzeri]